MNTAEVEAIFARTLAGDYESEDAWEAVRSLQQNGSREIFEYAAAWCASDDPLKRARAGSVLCQLRRGSIPQHEFLFRDESYVLLTNMLEKEQDPNVIYSILSAFGHLDNVSAVPLLLRYQDSPLHQVRYAACFALGCFPNDVRSIEALLKLTSDPEEAIREWAVFGLGVMGGADSPEIREALLRCLNDPDEDVREEAAVGLGKRQDPRLIPVLLKMMEDADFKVRVTEAAAALLGMDEQPPEWIPADYRAAIAKIGK
jgi:HEAT repeat protein